MLNGEEVGSRRNAQQLLNDLPGLENRRGKEVDRILRVQVKVGSVVPQRLHVGVASRHIVALGIRRSHVGRILADHVGDGSFVLDHLLLPHVGRNAGQAVVRPGMRGDLMTFVDHALQQVGPGSCGVDATFPQVVSRDVEGGRESILFEEVQEFRGVNIRAIVIGQGDDVGLGAAVDVLIVGDLAQARAWIGEGGWSLGRRVGIATPELPLAVGIPAVILFRAAVPLQATFSLGCSSPAGFGIRIWMRKGGEGGCLGLGLGSPTSGLQHWPAGHRAPPKELPHLAVPTREVHCPNWA